MDPLCRLVCAFAFAACFSVQAAVRFVDQTVPGLERPVHYFAAHSVERSDACETAVVIVHGWGDGVELPAKAVVEHRPGFLWLEAEEFADYGGWTIDTQFVGKMGSAYLLANGVTNRVASFSFLADGTRASVFSKATEDMVSSLVLNAGR